MSRLERKSRRKSILGFGESSGDRGYYASRRRWGTSMTRQIPYESLPASVLRFDWAWPSLNQQHWSGILFGSNTVLLSGFAMPVENGHLARIIVAQFLESRKPSPSFPP